MNQFDWAKMFWTMWPIWTFILSIIAIRLFFYWLGLEIDNWRVHRRFKEGERWRSDRELLQWLKGMNPSEFEDYIANLFNRLEYKAEAVGRSHDGGVDVIAEKGGIKHYIQCKKFITSTVSVGAVRDFYGAIADHLSNGKAYFITTNKFTLEAEKYAEDKPIELIDGHRLIEYIHLAEKQKIEIPKIKSTEIGNCPQCGSGLIQREGKFGKFLGCSNYPKCKFTKSLAK